MIKRRADMRCRTGLNVQGGCGLISAVNIFSSDEVEGSMTVCDVFCFKPGESIGKHIHYNEGELYYILEGIATVEDGENQFVLQAHDAHYCKNNGAHSIRNSGDTDMRMLAIVIPYGTS